MIEINTLRFRDLVIPALSLPAGTTAVIGPNGSGKTTFLRLLAGLALPEAGEIRIDGLSPRMSEIGWVDEFPDRNMLFSRVYDEIASPLRFRCEECGATDRRVEELAGEAGISHLLDRTSSCLSGGEKALISLMTALAARPRVLVLDEFDSHLDQEMMKNTDRILIKAGCAYIIRCTQQMNLAACADHVISLGTGTVVLSGTPEQVFRCLRGTSFYPPAWRLRDAVGL
jgi:energy-coupling factor transporter ATP-binding protein EcfA2